jgi:hypothetical protein
MVRKATEEADTQVIRTRYGTFVNAASRRFSGQWVRIGCGLSASADPLREVLRASPTLPLIGDASESPEMLLVKGDLDALACLLFQRGEHLLARLPEDLDRDRRV